MDDEIDLRQYVTGLIQRWPLILGLTLIAAVASTVVSLLLPNVYDAVALVSVSAPRYNLQPDSASVNAPLPARAYPELAQSGDVLTQVFSQTQSLLPNSAGRPAILADLQSRLTAETAADPTLVRLKASDSDPQVAAKLANVWADVFAARAGALYTQDQANLKLYTSQLSDAKDALANAQGDLAAFQSANQSSILSAQLSSQQTSLTDYLNRQHDLELLAQDTRDLISRLSALPASGPASPTDDLALLAITGRIYGAGGTSPGGLPIQVQLQAGQPLAGPTVADQLALAGNLRDTIAARLADIGSQAAALEPKILALQGQVAQAQVTQQALVQARDLADSQYRKLAGQVQDASLVAQASANTVQIASRAVVPTVKAGPHRATNVLLGTALGLVLGILASLALDFWRSSLAVPLHK